MSAERRTAGKVPVEEDTCQPPTRAKELLHFLHVRFAEGWIERAEKGLFDDQVISALQVEEVAGDQCQRGTGPASEFLLKRAHQDGGDVYQGNVGEPFFQEISGLIAIAATGDEDGEGSIGQLIEIGLQGRGDLSHIPGDVIGPVAVVPVVHR